MFYYKDATVAEMVNAHEALGFPLVCDGDAKIVWVDDSVWLGPLLGSAKRTYPKGGAEDE